MSTSSSIHLQIKRAFLQEQIGLKQHQKTFRYKIIVIMDITKSNMSYPP